MQIDGEPFSVTGPLVIEPSLPEKWLGSEDNQVFFTSHGAVQMMRGDGEGVLLVGPAGQPGGDHSGFAIAKDRDRVAARSAAGGIWVTRHASEARWQESIPGTELTDPSWHRDGTRWTFDRHNGQVLRSHPAVSRGPEHVAAPALQGMDVTSLRMATNGVRVAVLIGTRQVQVGARNGGGAGAMLSNFHLLTMAERDDKIIDIAWGDGDHLLVLVQTKAGQVGQGDQRQRRRDHPAPDHQQAPDEPGRRGRDTSLATTEDGKEILEPPRDRQNCMRSRRPPSTALYSLLAATPARARAGPCRCGRIGRLLLVRGRSARRSSSGWDGMLGLCWTLC